MKRGADAAVRGGRKQPREGAIVVGTDFSGAAHNAVLRAVAVAKQTGASIHLVHATGRLPASLARLSGVRPERLNEALDEIVAFVRQAGVDARGAVVTGAGPAALRRSSRAVSASLIVVGARGRTLRDGALGSTAERVAAFGSASVLLVRRPVRRTYRRVIVAIDRDDTVRACVEAARSVAPNAEISLLHAYLGPYESMLALQGASPATLQSYRRETRREVEDAMSERLRGAGYDPSSLVLRYGDARRVLARVEGDTLLALGRSQSLLRHVLLGSVARVVIERGTTDVLLV